MNNRLKAKLIVVLVILSAQWSNFLSPIISSRSIQEKTPGSVPAMQLLNAKQAEAIALNRFSPTREGISLNNPRFQAKFTSAGLEFTPHAGEVTWSWSLAGVYAGSRRLWGSGSALRQPVQQEKLAVSYPRNGFEERYMARQSSLEQQFILPAPLTQPGEELVIEGKVEAEGAFAPHEQGWTWGSDSTLVSLGQVTVFDAAGKTLPARMEAESRKTRIVVAASGLAQATYPVTVDPEIGVNDFKISSMGIDVQGDVNFSDVAYNSTEDEFLVVWSGYTTTLLKSNIYAQRVDAATGEEIGTDFKIGEMGGQNDAQFNALTPAVAYNSTNNTYLAVWSGDDTTDDEFEIWGQQVTAAGAQTGTDDFRISTQGANGNGLIDASFPAVAYNSANNEFLVAWHGDGGPGTLDEEFEIYIQRINASTGAEIGGDVRISDVGGLNEANFDAFAPAVAYNPDDGQYLVVFQADDDAAGASGNDNSEIYGQRLTASTGAEVGTSDFMLSDMGTAGNANFDSELPAVAYNNDANQYLVVWQGEDDTLGLADGETEIFGQRLNAANGSQVGTDDFRISSMGPDNNNAFDAAFPDVAFDAQLLEYLVVWQGDDNINGLVDEEREIFGQRLDGNGAQVNGAEFRLSQAGTDGSSTFIASIPSVAYSATSHTMFSIWQADDDGDESGVVDNEFEIFGELRDSENILVSEDDLRYSTMGADFGNGFMAATAYNSINQEFLVVWVGTGNHPGEEIYTQRIDAASGEQIGANDFRITDIGEDVANVVKNPQVAYNSTDNEYLVVWIGDDISGGLGEKEVFGQRLNAATGAEVGTDDFRISSMGAENDSTYFPSNPAVAYNSTNNEYLVVWEGNNDFGSLVAGETEIWAQRLNAASGAEVGTDDFRISALGPDGDAAFDAAEPAVAYNGTNNEYLVVFRGRDTSFVAGDVEVWAQRLNAATGAEVGSDDFKISTVGPSATGGFAGSHPDVAYNPLDNEYLVVWDSNHSTDPQQAGGQEIYGQRLAASTGAEVGADDFRFSDMGPETGPYRATDPAISFSTGLQEYYLVWAGQDDTPPYVGDETEIFSQRIARDGSEIETDTPLSDMGYPGDIRFDAALPALASDQVNLWLVVWESDDTRYGLFDQNFEIFGQFVQEVQNLTQIFLPVVVR